MKKGTADVAGSSPGYRLVLLCASFNILNISCFDSFFLSVLFVCFVKLKSIDDGYELY